jgi:predicted Zn-ribbon and HTH transcriptional regulator
MQILKLKEGEVSTEVYIILRVFNFGKDNIDMRLYVDPDEPRKVGFWFFSPEWYSILSAGSAGS